MRLLFIRHGDPDYQNDTITEHGHREAKALAERMYHEKIDRIFCSTMKRAMDTMSYTAELTGIRPICCEWMREVEWTDFINDAYVNPWDLPGEKLLVEPDLPTAENWINNPYFDADKVSADRARRSVQLDNFLAQNGYRREGAHYIETRKNEEKIAMFCHAGFEMAMISYLLNIPLTLMWAGFWMAPTSVTTILFAKRDSDIVVPRCIGMCDISHLYKEGINVKPRGLKGSFV